MLVSGRELFLGGQKNGYAIGAFNVYNLEQVKAVIQAAEGASAPVILQFGTGALRFVGYAQLIEMARTAARSAGVPVAVHLDHAKSIAELEEAARLGVTSAMIDGSSLQFQENIDMVRRAVEVGHSYDIPIEAELGRLSGSEDAARPVAPVGELTDPEQAEKFVAATGIDALAVSIGNVHGFYATEPNLDLNRLQAIRERVSVPLVLHGTSGIPDETIRAAIAAGIVKFNLNTELRIAYIEALHRELALPNPAYDITRVMKAVIKAVGQVAADKIRLFGAASRSTL